MNILVLTTEPISGPELREALGSQSDLEGVQVKVVAPALHESALRFRLSDADEAIERADAVRRKTVERLGEDGVAAAGDTGEGDPVAAIEDALRDFDADRIVVFTHPESVRRYREDVDEDELARRFGVPVERARVSG